MGADRVIDQGNGAGTSRRAVLGGAIGALAAVAAQTLGRPLATRAANNDPLTAGNIVTGATATTGVTTATGHGFQGTTSAGAGSSGLFGRNTGPEGAGVTGDSDTGPGVLGTSDASDGVVGRSGSGGASGIYGENTDGGYGVSGRSDAASGSGVYGRSDNGYAIAALGRVSFSTSGLTTVPVGTSSKQIAPFGLDLTPASTILCTLESNQVGLAIQRVTKNVTNDTFKVFISNPVAAGKTAKVAWFVIG